MPTKIQWTDETWNPVTGCTRVSDGCTNCYSVTMTRRLAAMGQEKYQGLVNPGKGHFNGVVKTHPDELEKPLRWRKPRRVFVNSMSDLFHEGVSFEFVDRVFAVMALTPYHTYQILTKRPERMAEYMLDDYRLTRWALSRLDDGDFDLIIGEGLPLKNVWLGTSCENQQAADERIPNLLRTPAAVRFLSCEPLLGPLDLKLNLTLAHDDWRQRSEAVHWVIVGGESGPGARPMHPDWARLIRNQCVEASVPFFFKQWGAWGEWEEMVARLGPDDETIDSIWRREHPWNGKHGSGRVHLFGWQTYMGKVGKKKAGRLLDGREWNEYPA